MLTNINQEAVGFIDEAGKVLKEAQDLTNVLLAEETKIASEAPKVVGLLIEQGLLKEADRNRAVEKLASHTGALEVVQNLTAKMAADSLEFRQKLAAAGNGEPVTAERIGQQTKSSGVNRLAGGIIGARRGVGQKSAADLAFEETLGIN
jgi:hypothetical protein